MRRILVGLILANLIMGGLVGRVQAIAVADLPTSEAPPTAEGYSFNWDYIYPYNGSSSVAVDHYWILTAGHVAANAGVITIDGEDYTQQESVTHSQAADPDGNPMADLALIRFDKPFPGYYLLHEAIPEDTEVLVVGCGFPGDVVMSPSSGYFTEEDGGSRMRRWGTNKIDGTSIVFDSKGFDFSISGTAGKGKTVYEAGCNDKDSGSGVFYKDNGTWKLVGTVANRYGASPNFTGNFAVATSLYKNWIKSVIVDYDTDMDGLPDEWEALYGVTEAEGYDDSDGFTNYEEWLADTDPTNGISFFEILDESTPTQLVFRSSTNRIYQVEHKDNLANTNAWKTYISWFEGSHSQTERAVSTSPSNRFYRVRVKLR